MACQRAIPLSTSSAKRKFKLALCQLDCGSPDKSSNLQKARRAIDAAVAGGAEFVALPECFNSPYDTTQFRKYAEKIPNINAKDSIDIKANPTTKFLSDAAKENKVWLLAFDPNGLLVAKHRKVHLFDIDIPGGQYFKESDTLSAGNCFTTFDTPWCKMGLAICYDVRFAELSMRMRDEGCEMLLFPAAFNVTTGPLHWELLMRARAVDNQVYVAGVSPARNSTGGYQAWGHSLLVDPWGKVVAGGDEIAEVADIIIADIDLDIVDTIRKNIPIGYQRRKDVYEA
eukprot:GSMAST32.ASY1.ANO1.816.1 assembled CDS